MAAIATLPAYSDHLIAQAALCDTLLSAIRLRKYSEPDDYSRAAEIRLRGNEIQSELDALRDLGEAQS